MSSGNSPALSYHAQQFRVRLDLTRAMALNSPVPPVDLIQRAKAKLESVKKEGKIAFYDIYEDKLQAVWRGLRAADGQPPTLSVSFTLAAGSPVIPGLTCSLNAAKSAVLVSLSKPIDPKAYPREWIRASILHFAKQQGIRGGLFLPQVQSAIFRVTNGEVIENFQISAASAVPAVPLADKVFVVMANKSRGEIVVFVSNISNLQSDEALENLNTSIRQTMEKLKAAGMPPLRFLKADVAACIKGAMTGPERVGVGMPLAVLAAIPVDIKAIAALKPSVKKYLNFHISDDKMSASIAEFDMKLYADPAFKMTKSFLTEQMAVSNIKFGLTDEGYSKVEEMFNKRLTLNDLVVAQGKPAVVGVGPYLHLVYKDAPKESVDEDVVNVRDSQQRTIVQKNQFVAEVRFATLPALGTNVYGQNISPEEGAALPVTIGEGIIQREPGKFYADCDGLPRFEDGKLTISKVFVHQGDVNLKSGNIYFDGPVEITGSVEVGAVVRVRGPLKVHGSIAGGIVISREGIEVLQSIVTGEKGKVICSSSIKADFIENSVIECAGSIIVNRSLVTSEIIAGSLIHALASDGVIGGGTIMCRGAVIAANIGFAKGARTTFNVGVDPKVIRRINIRKHRLENLQQAQDRYKNEFRELAQKKESQLTLKHKQLKESLKEKMANVRPIIEAATAAYEAVKGTMTYNSDSIIAASNVFAANCQIEIGGYGVVMEADTIAAAVTPKKRRDSHICTYDEVKSEIERKIGGASSAAPKQETKKAG